jgi:hypothetical protein
MCIEIQYKFACKYNQEEIVTASFHHGLMPIEGRGLKRRAPILLLKIHATASNNELFRDGRMTSTGRAVERRDAHFNVSQAPKILLHTVLQNTEHFASILGNVLLNTVTHPNRKAIFLELQASVGMCCPIYWHETPQASTCGGIS